MTPLPAKAIICKTYDHLTGDTSYSWQGLTDEALISGELIAVAEPAGFRRFTLAGVTFRIDRRGPWPRSYYCRVIERKEERHATESA